MIALTVHYGHLIRVLHCCCDQSMTENLEKMDLTASQGRLMGYIAHRKGAPTYAKDVEAALDLSHPTVSGLLSRLEQKGFIALETDPKDRRSKQIVLQEKGRACLEKMHQLMTEHEERIVRGFSPAEREQFRVLLQRAIENVHPDNGGIHQKEETKA